ncbi:MAG: hypothetical protein JWM56_1056 [Candidatus Peribacteria bacterium]|nr:hypothetical protein [Candidatus Peribacteria bacterium]
MKKVVLCFGHTDFVRGPAMEVLYEEMYKELGTALADLGVALHGARVSGYLGGNKFAEGSVFQNGQFTLLHEPFEADVILPKSSAFYADSNARVINPKSFELLFNDKMYMAARFPHLFPRTIMASNMAQLGTALQRIPGERIVMKPVSDYGGAGVVIDRKENIAEQASLFPVIVQSFVDTSKGIPGITHSVSDLRIIVTGIGKEYQILLMYYREPAPGLLVSNFARGGSIVMMTPAQWPAGAVSLVEEVEKEFHAYGARNYCIDCACDANGKWFMYEVNVPPGEMLREECGSQADRYTQGMVDLFLKA